MKILIAIILLLQILTAASPAFAATGSTGLGCGGGFGPIAEFLCTLTKTAPGTDPKTDPQVAKVANKFNTVISGIISLLTVLAGLWFLFRFIVGGINWIGSGGDKSKIEQAQDTINNALIGLFIVVGAWIIVGIVGSLLGFEILNPGNILRTVGL